MPRAASTVNTTNNTLSLSGISDFSDWTGSPENPLPISLISFYALCESEGVKLNWETASETNNDFFSLDKSVDGQLMKTIHTCKGAGTSTIKHSYSYFDNTIQRSDNPFYYRLKQTDFDGKFSYSKIVSCESKLKSCDFTIFPNPATTEQLNVLIKCILNDRIQLSVFSENGTVVCSGIIDSEQNQEVAVNILDYCSISPGVYFVSLIGDNYSQNKKVIVK